MTFLIVWLCLGLLSVVIAHSYEGRMDLHSVAKTLLLGPAVVLVILVIVLVFKLTGAEDSDSV